MKLTVSTPSGLHIEFEGAAYELPRLDTFLEEIARVERERVKLPAVQQPVASLTIDAGETFVPFPDPSPPTALGLAAEPDGGDHRPDTPTTGTAGEPSRPPARTSPPAGGTGRPRQNQERIDQVLAAVREHAPAARISDVCEATGLSVKNARRIVQDLVRDGVLVAEGATVKRRYRLAGSDTAPDTQPGEQAETPVPAADPVDTVADITPVVRRQQAPHECRVIGVEARARMDAEREERNALGRERILALVAEHGPVSYSWVADQLVKNRRDTAALMRDMTLAGELAETDEGGYYDVPDRDDQAQARSLAHRSLVAATPDSPARRCPTCEGNRQEFRGLRDELARVKAAASPDERLREAATDT